MIFKNENKYKKSRVNKVIIKKENLNIHFNKKVYFKEDDKIIEKRDQLLNLLKAILVLEQIISKYQELPQQYMKNKKL